MKKTKYKRKTFIVLCFLLLLILSIIGGYTYSKYFTKVEGTGRIQVGKWVFEVNGETAQMANIQLGETYDKTSLVEGKIAPGTRGSFDIVIDATGCQTAVDYAITFNDEGYTKPQNMYFTYQGQKFFQIEELDKVLKGTISTEAENKKITFTIGWQWDYETTNAENSAQYDAQDTKDGINLQEYAFQILVTGTQVNPEI